ncbi:PspC domain-containing protein [Corynebacterium afermentans subsp. lipophilum]|uniref:PspC domain-containing protein n=1 Tax=Corynebacterium afermentans TaxID=38286 RepID=UPI00188A0E9F|nr:PspC domain-containing protein [Corynebacterium afermentans]MBF4547611.1 PspC domain-containing protein [Corynebacterium afermentans subsp. lipophilum]WJY58675.1 DNA-binding transcriptional activator PspC [Corynebacterium afermentans subsp. lipophilum]
MSSPYNPQHINPSNSPKRLERSMTDKYIAGVCGGIAQYLGVDATAVRVVFILLVLMGVFPGLLAYGVAWLIMPAEF